MASAIIYSSPSAVPDEVVMSLDSILVLGGGVPSSAETPPLYVQRRCDDAAAVRERRQRHPTTEGGNDNIHASLPILCLSAGTAHLPQLLCIRGLPIWESTASAAYLQSKHGVDASDLFVETTSYDTIGNAYFARTSHTDVNGWRKLLVVTNAFHMARSKAIFDWIFSLDPVAGSGGTAPPAPGQYELHYLSSPDIGLSDEALAARAGREAASLRSVTERLAPRLTSLHLVWRFLHTEHDLYAAKGLVQRAAARMDSPSSGASTATTESEVDEAVKKSYGGGASMTTTL